MSFYQGIKHFLINQNSDYPVTFFNASGVEQTTLANIRANATVMDIQFYGRFNLSEIRDVRASRGFNQTLQRNQISEDDITLSAPSAGTTNVYFNFRTQDYEYTSAFGRINNNYGVDQRFQVVVASTDDEGNVLAKLFEAMAFSFRRYANPQDVPVTATILTGARVSGTYTNGTAFTNVTLTADYDGSSALGGVELTNPVASFTTIDHATSSTDVIRFQGTGNEQIFNIAVEGDDFNLSQSTVVLASSVNVPTQASNQGRNNTEWINENWVLPTENTTRPYYGVFNDQLAIPNSLYTNIQWSIRRDRNIRGGLTAIDSIHTSESMFDIMYLENSINLANSDTGPIARILAFLTKDGKSVNGYELYNQDYLNPSSAAAVRNNILSGNNATAWAENTHSGVIRTGIDGTTAQNVNDVADFLDDVQTS